MYSDYFFGEENSIQYTVGSIKTISLLTFLSCETFCGHNFVVYLRLRCFMKIKLCSNFVTYR